MQRPRAAAACFAIIFGLLAAPSTNAASNTASAPASTLAYPLPKPDGAALKQWLQRGQYEALETALEQYRVLSIADISTGERHLWTAYKTFQSTDSAMIALLDAWVEARPHSSEALIARAHCNLERGLEARGTKYISKTPQESIVLMKRLFDLAKRDAEAALKLQPSNVAPHRISLIISKHLSAQEFAASVVVTNKAFPASYILGTSTLYGLQPKWHGSIELIEKVARESQGHAAQNPNLKMLLGYPDWARAEILSENGDLAAALAAYTRALSFGEEPDFLVGRIRVASKLNRFDLALADSTRLAAHETALESYKKDLKAASDRAWKWVKITYAEGSLNETLKTLNALVAYEPNNVEAVSFRGVTLCQLKRYDAAMLEFARARSLDANDYENAHRSRVCMANSGKLKEATLDLQKYVLTAPGDPGPRVDLADFAIQGGDPSSAFLSYKIACANGDVEACNYADNVASKVEVPTVKTPQSPQQLLRSQSQFTAYTDSLKSDQGFERLNPQMISKFGKPVLVDNPVIPPFWSDLATGLVSLQLYVETDGSIIGATVIDSTAPDFELAAVDSALMWKFMPYGTKDKPLRWTSVQQVHIEMEPALAENAPAKANTATPQ